MRKSKELEKEAVLDIAALMVAAARTAPKTRGIDNIEIHAIEDERTKKAFIKKMKVLASQENRRSLERDANCIGASPAIIVIGVKSNPAGLNCGFCGYGTCQELKNTKGICAYNSIDLGIAISSAASLASRFHIDNRVMYSIGMAGMRLGIFGKDVKQALGIPLSVTGKNPFFDRK